MNPNLTGERRYTDDLDITGMTDCGVSLNDILGGQANGSPALAWQTHNRGQNILFADGHARWFKGYDTNEMTFRYDSIHGWE